MSLFGSFCWHWLKSCELIGTDALLLIGAASPRKTTLVQQCRRWVTSLTSVFFNLVILSTLGYFINNNINVIFQQSSLNTIWLQNILCLYNQLSVHQSGFVEQCSQSTRIQHFIWRYTLTDNRSDSQAVFGEIALFGNAVDKNWHLAIPELIPYLCCICLGCVFLFGHNG